MRTPEEIAEQFATGLVGGSDSAIADRWMLVQIIANAVRVDRKARRAGTLVVSTRDGKVRTGLTENTVTDLTEIIAGYIADGYDYDELGIEGVME